MYIVFRISPGWAGLCMRPELSMVIFIIDLERVTVLEREGNAIVLINPHRVSAALERVKPRCRHVHLSRMRRGIESGEDQVKALSVLRLYLARISGLEQ